LLEQKLKYSKISRSDVNTYQEARDTDVRDGCCPGCGIEGILIVRGRGILGTSVEAEALDCSSLVACAEESTVEGLVG
jgi:hypothetical protein